MKKGTRASFMATLSAVGCWGCVSALWTTPVYAQSGATGDEMDINFSSDPSAGAVIRSYLINQGSNAYTWNSPSGSASPVGEADGADHVVAGLSSGQIEVKYTLIGDASIDGLVTGTDFTALVGNLGKAVSGWDAGNFLYNDLITGDDFTALVGNLGEQAGGANVGLPAADYAAVDAFAAANGLAANVPEPVSIGLLAISGLAILSRRRRSI
jgi:hypothetical protein